MESFTSQQKQILDDFIQQTKSILELGFAHSVAHEEYRKKLDCHEKKIQLLKSFKRQDPHLGNCLDRLQQQAYIQYIIILFRAGLNYTKNHPQYLNLIDQVQRVLNEYGRHVRNSDNHLPSAAYFKPVNGRNGYQQFSQSAAKRSFIHETFRQSNPVRRTPYSINTRTVPARQSPSTDDNNTFEEIYQQVNNLSNKIDEIQNKTYNLENSYSNRRCYKRSSDCLQKLNDELTKQLHEIQNEKKERMRQHANARKFDQTMPKRNLKNIYDEPLRDESINEYPSEMLINKETFIKPQQQHQSMLRPPKIEKIERNIVIPVQVDENQRYPKIKPYAYFEKAGNGLMRINVRLEFDENVLFNDKSVDHINVQHILVK